MRSIRVFDDSQRQDAKEQAKAMRGSDQPLNECIEFGRVWHRDGYGLTAMKYDAAKKLRELEELEESA